MSEQPTPVPREEFRPAPTDIAPKLADLQVGRTVVTASIPLSRADLVRYAGASGDYNHIHWNERFAREVGLENVIAHGMLTMGTAINGLVEAIGDPAAVREYAVRFTSPVEVPATGSVTLQVTAVVGAIDEEHGTARIDLTAQVDETKVLGRARATIALPASTGTATPAGGVA